MFSVVQRVKIFQYDISKHYMLMDDKQSPNVCSLQSKLNTFIYGMPQAITEKTNHYAMVKLLPLINRREIFYDK